METTIVTYRDCLLQYQVAGFYNQVPVLVTNQPINPKLNQLRVPVVKVPVIRRADVTFNQFIRHG
jgi:hypothetical protein